MNIIQTITKRGVFKSGKRYTIITNQYEFFAEIWDLIKAFMIDYEPFVMIEDMFIPRSLIVGYNLYPFERKSKTEREFKKVSKYQELLLDYKTEEEATQGDEECLYLDCIYIREKNLFLVDFTIENNGGYLPIYFPDYGGSSPLAYAIGNVVDNGSDEDQRGMRQNKVIELCYKKCRNQFAKHMKQRPKQDDTVEEIFNSLKQRI